MSFLPKISVITAIYNRVNFVAAVCSSFSAQSYQNKEHILVDGGSIDGTLLALKEYSNNTGVKLISQPDEGIYDAINKGISLASGDIIGLLHSDDIYADTEVLGIVAQQFEDLELDAIYGDAAFFKLGDTSKCVRVYKSHRFSIKSLSWGWMPAHTTLYVRRRVFEKFGVYKTSYKIAGDVDFIARIFSSEDIKYKYIPKILVYMSMGGISTSGLKSTLILNMEMLRALKDNKVRTNLFKILTRYPFKLLECLRSSKE